MRLKLDDLRRAVTTEESNDMVQNYHEKLKNKGKDTKFNQKYKRVCHKSMTCPLLYGYLTS